MKEGVKSVSQLITIFGVPFCIMTDRGSAFMTHTLKTFCTEHSIKHLLNVVAISRANGQCERMNRTVLSSLAATCVSKAEEF